MELVTHTTGLLWARLSISTLFAPNESCVRSRCFPPWYLQLKLPVAKLCFTPFKVKHFERKLGGAGISTCYVLKISSLTK